MTKKNALTSTTQEFLDLYDIANDLVILKTGAAALIITVTAMNFGLLAEEEQDAIIYGYAGLLNSLNYPIQILIRSQTKDITNYLNLLKVQEDQTVNRVKKQQLQRYREFVADLVQERNVLDKKFYVIIPATALELGLVTTQSVIPGIKSPDISTFDRSVILERAKNLLEPKRDHLMSQFARIGLLSRQLTTQEIIQLFYTEYNPEAVEGQRMTDTSNYTTAMVDGTAEENILTTAHTQMPQNLRKHQTFVVSPTMSTASPAPAISNGVQAPPITPAAPPRTPSLVPAVSSDMAPITETPTTENLPPPAEIV